MAQDRDQYVQFTIKLLKGSFALSALWQDAVNYHMIDQPEKLIALRLTEYYEMIMRAGGRPAAATPAPPLLPASLPAPIGTNGHLPPQAPSGGNMPADQQPTAAIRMPRLRPQPAEARPPEQSSDIVASADVQVVEQNADEAADYWTPL
ncbi:MAG TPA: hypothetical protein VGF67_14915 [Ktedonobacteraceae bacterium]|jgi:hypothetical protein